MRPSTVTLRSIAAEAGVSHTTVSLALRNSPTIPAATRDHIRAIVERLGYSPDPVVSKVMKTLRFQQKGGRVLGYLTTFGKHAAWRTHRVYGRVFAGAERRAAELGYRLDILALDERGMTNKRMKTILDTRGIQGAIVAARPKSHSHLSLDLSAITAIASGNSLTLPRLHRVTTDHIQALLLALRTLRRFGNRRIGVAMRDELDERVEHRWTAAHAVFEKHLPAQKRMPMFLCAKWERATFQSWVGQHRPDAIVALGEWVPTWLAEMGLRVPEDVQFVQLDWAPGDEKKFAAIDQQHEIGGMAEVDLLLSEMHMHRLGPPPATHTLLIESRWVDGPTARPRAERIKRGSRGGAA